MVQRAIFIGEDEINDILGRSIKNVDGCDPIIESFGDSWIVYKKQNFLDRTYGKKACIVIKKQIINGINCECLEEILVDIIKDLRILSVRKKSKIIIKVRKIIK